MFVKPRKCIGLFPLNCSQKEAVFSALAEANYASYVVHEKFRDLALRESEAESFFERN
jgi:hypothetical protein